LADRNFRPNNTIEKENVKTPYPSGTAVLLKETGGHFEILLVRRNTELTFHGGAWVFPGGRVEKQDFAHDNNDIIGAARNAAVRETKEESGIDIQPEDLVLMSRWTTPENFPKRFIAWFFVTTVESDHVTIDGNEILDYRWMKPGLALEAQRSEEIVLPPPTFVTLLTLSEYTDAKTTLSTLEKQGHMIYIPKVSKTDDGECFLYTGDAGYESNDVHQPGARHRLWMSKGQYRYERD
jgi:8-oxo-dGTP pyrophosphatase MutT (NUDIX family)